METERLNLNQRSLFDGSDETEMFKLGEDLDPYDQSILAEIGRI